ncbi:pH-sensitive chloride channel 2-like isoform X2 [Condylostylus longicornis]|uniref:pH-sensitive chloride channel 2-like isoform X2 n=1 Tax=Condylostylus longicornis TaxID=2530218 RepID=UPI00244DDA81|nr:pH-sensitive chloride channel 2-like isoform X2 [Condylostylus longicornis]
MFSTWKTSLILIILNIICKIYAENFTTTTDVVEFLNIDDENSTEYLLLINNNTDLDIKSSTENILEITTLLPEVNITEELLIPPANVTPNIELREEESKEERNQTEAIVIVKNDNCPSLENADSFSQTQLIERLVHKCRYDRLERPLTFDGEGKDRKRLPVKVYARAHIYFMQILGADNLQFKIHALLQLRFVDPRLAFKQVSPNRNQPIFGEKSLRDAIWKPHIFISNEKNSDVLGTDQKDYLTSISADGTVILSTRIQATLYCWMNLKKFPLDEQQCKATFESWMYNTTELVLLWEIMSPVTLAPDTHLTEYKLLAFNQTQQTIVANLSDLRHGAFAGNYSCLHFTVYLAREMGFYLLSYFLPSIMIVAISWVSFWLQADQSAPRITLGINTMLAFITLASAQSKTLPKVSYIKVSEIWFLGCTAFIFGSLVEFAFVNIIWRRHKEVKLKKVNSKYILKSTLTPRLVRKEFGELQKAKSCANLFVENTLKPIDVNQSIANGNTRFLTSSTTVRRIPTIIRTESQNDVHIENDGNNNGFNEASLGWTTMTPKEVANWIDRRSRTLFPVAFLIFNILFWSFVYLL